MKPSIFSVLNEHFIYHTMIQTFQQECVWSWYIHTGVKPGNRKPGTYLKYLRRLGWDVEELRLCIPEFDTEPFNPYPLR